MVQVDAQLSTGLPGLDRALKGLMPGDNVVFQVEATEDYRPFVQPFVRSARQRGKQLVYFRFASHPPLIQAGAAPGVEIHTLHPDGGFEHFLAEIHRIIERTGAGFYVFDCLSELVVDWYSDQMLGNFFKLTCPYLFDVGAIAYFMLLRNHHSLHAITPILDTTQIFIDVYRHKGTYYVHPLKVQQRYSPTMHMLHAWQGEDFPAITRSEIISEVLNSATGLGLEALHARPGFWHRMFQAGEDLEALMRAGKSVPSKGLRQVRSRLMRMALSRDERVLNLLEKYLDLSDVLKVNRRMIGTGLIGGKSVGMLLARAILVKQDPHWAQRLESHDSFYIGSDVFYTFLVRNGIWWVRQKQRDKTRFLEGAETARQRMLTGEFPEYVLRQIEHMLDYFGQSPIIVRSSSLLEDNFGNAFAGKYESVFCANQGSRDKRLDDFLSAVRTIYASTMSEKALRYRAQKGILERDEQMALLVQRVSGAMYGGLYYPQIAGVGFSFNPYVWNEQIDPQAGMLRLVFGLGTRAVDRNDDDYTRVVALNDPMRRPEADFNEVRQYAQHKVDVLDLESNQLTAWDLGAVLRKSEQLPIERFAVRDEAAARRAEELGLTGACPWVLTFDNLFTQTPFIQEMREALQLLQKAYDYPVDIEFTANFAPDGSYKINLVQCRPFQVKSASAVTAVPDNLPARDVVLEARGAVIGTSRVCTVDRVVYVVPAIYGQLPVSDRYALARVINSAMHLEDGPSAGSLLLIGPGRWGTTTPSLGIPVSFADINTVSVLCEVVAMREDLVPDVSLGTHFFNDLVEMNILYMALFPHREGNRLNFAWLEKAPNRLPELLPEHAAWASCLRIIDPPATRGRALKLNASALNQQVVCYLERKR